ncbi:MAG: NADH-quinone oxidoreductase subunit F [Desulfobacterota bacterium]|nr:NADH-quinone oxidoreductase subunit F [Thermodesulfobacteriota bacterium]
MKIQKPEDLTKVKTHGSQLLVPATVRITVGAATCGCAKGALKVIEALKHELKKQKVKADVVMVGCNGMCFAEPIVEVIKAGKPRITYGHVSVDRVADVVKSVKTGKVIEDLALLRYDEDKPAVCQEPLLYARGKVTAGYAKIKEYKKLDFFNKQLKLVSRNAGTISPERIEEYIARGGYAALAKALSNMTPQDVIDEVKASKLRGRGGAGFPTGIKWEACRTASGERKYVVCNGSEGDPEIAMHRSFLESDPHVVIEGMVLAGFAVGAQEGFIYLNDRYTLAYERVTAAIKQAEQIGLLGERIMGSPFSFTVKVKRGGGAYICGEETALLNALEGSFGEPRPRPPFPVQKGLFGMPTVVNNLETLANIPLIVLHGGKWFAKIGTSSSTGTKIVSLSGSVAQRCWVEIPMGTSVETIVTTFGKTNPKKVKAFQTGGPSGGILPAKALKVKLDYDALAKQGTLLGSGGLLVMDESTDMVDMARFFLDFFAEESCGKCVPCREGVKRLQEIVATFLDGRGTKEHLEVVKRMNEGMRDASFCALGKTAAAPLLSVMQHFPRELEKRMAQN